MRRLPKRPKVSAEVKKRLKAETEKILRHADRKAEADLRYGNARRTTWFAPVVTALGKLAGAGGRCMFCSGSEASDVEHYRPKAVFPELAMTWENYLWCCTPCNRGKLNRFPPDTEPGGRFVNPLDEDVWKFFFIDEFGFLTPRYDKKAKCLDPCAVATRDFMNLNREAVQESRQLRLDDLKERVEETLQLLKLRKLTKAKAKAKIQKWRTHPFQPDVADYFFDGPGKEEAPFKSFLAALK
jgi:hypothetical protein